ncbi:UNVERIFIED_CONTAM: hypothetical protein Sangu_3225800 [Sesamum angustifolium]|uniref:Uncharacterized protein n=1 Tax=Sesamum angustifolium TaxID=2727405 RepID=A0AAW2JJ95_9LAMI
MSYKLAGRFSLKMAGRRTLSLGSIDPESPFLLQQTKNLAAQYGTQGVEGGASWVRQERRTNLYSLRQLYPSHSKKFTITTLSRNKRQP